MRESGSAASLVPVLREIADAAYRGCGSGSPYEARDVLALIHRRVRQVLRDLDTPPSTSASTDEPEEEWPNGTLALLTCTLPSGEQVRHLVERVDDPSGDEEPYRWRILGASDWLTWDGLRAEGELTRLYTQSQVDQLLASAEVEQIGHHGVHRASGYCHTCGVHHSPQEIDRARQRAEGEAN